jgi:transcriptional regulator with XRE-family HTH domain
MAPKAETPDARRERIAALMAKGLNQAQVAKRLGVSPQTISRTLRDHRAERPTQDAVDVFVASLGDALAPDVAARVAGLRNLAKQLDWCAGAGTGTAAMATASLNKEYESMLEKLKQMASFDALTEALLAAGDD